MLLRMGLLLRLGPSVIIDGTFITLGSSYYTRAFYILIPWSYRLRIPSRNTRALWFQIIDFEVAESKAWVALGFWKNLFTLR